MENKQKTYSFISFPKITTRPCFQFSTTFLLFTLSAPPLSSSLSRFTSSSSSSTRTTTTTFDAEMVMGSSNSDLANLNSSGAMGEPSISCTTFNILAPIYKRLDQQKNQNTRESDFRAFWFSRNQRILDWLLYERSSIICLQEFWVGNEELVHMYQERLGDAGYITFKLARTNNRGDGLLTAVRKDYFEVLNHRELLFNDFGDRVAQLLHVQSAVPLSMNGKDNIQQEILIVNTHLLFPHDSSLSIVRLHQVYEILKYVETYQKDNKLNNMPIILCGDWNGSKRGHVYKFLRSQGFVSSYDIAHQYTDSDADAHKWVSHRNHRGNICGVDFIWLRNPSKSRKPLKTSWAEAVFGIIKYQLRKASSAESDAFQFLRADNHANVITYSDFCEALQQVNLTGLSYGLSFQEIKDLWTQADTDGNGVLDYEEFKDAYVICKMKKKGSEKTVDSYGDRGEPSRPPVSDNENYAPRNTILEEILQSQVNADDYLASLNDHDVLDHDWHVKLPDEGISLNDLDCSIDLSIDQNGPQQQFYFPDEEEELDPEFVNALFADEDESPHGETVHTFRHGYSQPMSVTGVYFENSSDTDTEILHGRSGRILEATGSSVGSSSSNQHKQMHVEDVFHGDEILKRDSLSELLHTDTPASVEPFVTTNTCKAQYRSVRGFLTQESPKRFQLREHEPALKNQAKEVSKQVTSVDLRKKKISMKNSEKQQKIVKVSDGQNQTIAKGMSSGPVSNDRKGPFIFFEKSQSRHEPSPPSLYFGNVLLGLFLFIIVVREVVYCH